MACARPTTRLANTLLPHFFYVAVAFAVVVVALHHSEGVYRDKRCALKPSRLNHAVILVGWGTDRDFGDYWIVKNSWYGVGALAFLGRLSVTTNQHYVAKCVRLQRENRCLLLILGYPLTEVLSVCCCVMLHQLLLRLPQEQAVGQRWLHQDSPRRQRVSVTGRFWVFLRFLQQAHTLGLHVQQGTS